MRITVVPLDGRVSIDGVGYDGMDLSSLDSSVHAVQWYDTEGDVEIKDARGRIVENREITSFDDFAFVIPLWEAAFAADELLKAELAAKMETQANVAAQTL